MDLHNPHNDLFGFTFNDKRSVITFIKNFLPKQIIENLDFNYFIREDTSHITKEMKAFFSDKVWSSKWKGTATNVKVSFLFEHKSSPENPWIQLNQYLIEGYRQQILELRSTNKRVKQKRRIRFTVIIPILFYHGEQAWHYRPFEDYFDVPDPYLKQFIPSFQYLLTDLSKYTDKELFALEIGFLFSTLLLLKHKRDKDFIKQNHEEIFIFVEKLRNDPISDDFLEIMILYILKTYNMEKQEVIDIVKTLPPKVKLETMSTYDKLIAEGVIKGKAEGKAEGKSLGLKQGKLEVALYLLVEVKMDIAQVAKATDISKTFIQQILTGFDKKALIKTQEIVLKSIKKINVLTKKEENDLSKLIKKYYQLFQKKKK